MGVCILLLVGPTGCSVCAATTLNRVELAWINQVKLDATSLMCYVQRTVLVLNILNDLSFQLFVSFCHCCIYYKCCCCLLCLAIDDYLFLSLLVYICVRLILCLLCCFVFVLTLYRVVSMYVNNVQPTNGLTYHFSLWALFLLMLVPMHFCYFCTFDNFTY